MNLRDIQKFESIRLSDWLDVRTEGKEEGKNLGFLFCDKVSAGIKYWDKTYRKQYNGNHCRAQGTLR